MVDFRRVFVCIRLLGFAFFLLFVLPGPCARSRKPLSPCPSGLSRHYSTRCWCLLGVVELCCYDSAARRCTVALQWTSAAAAVSLMLATGTSIQKCFLVPFFALQAPSTAISWIKGEKYGRWTAFIGLLVCLLRLIPGGELELLLSTMLFVILAPNQFMNLRGSQGGAALSLVIAAYLFLQHFTGLRGLRQQAFGHETIIASLCIICMTVTTLMLVH